MILHRRLNETRFATVSFRSDLGRVVDADRGAPLRMEGELEILPDEAERCEKQKYEREVLKSHILIKVQRAKRDADDKADEEAGGEDVGIGGPQRVARADEPHWGRVVACVPGYAGQRFEGRVAGKPPVINNSNMYILLIL